MVASTQVPSDKSALEMFADAGIISDRSAAPAYLQLFAEQADRVLDKVSRLVQQGRGKCLLSRPPRSAIFWLTPARG